MAYLIVFSGNQNCKEFANISLKCFLECICKEFLSKYYYENRRIDEKIEIYYSLSAYNLYFLINSTKVYKFTFKLLKINPPKNE